MKKGISFYWGFNQKPEDSARIIKEVGFDCVITSTDEKYKHQNGSLRSQVKLLKKYNIELSSLHGWYDIKKSRQLWIKGFRGYLIYKRLISDVKKAYKYGFNSVVVHLYGTPSEVGLNRIRKVLKVCEKVKVPIAIENIKSRDCFEYVFKNIDSKYLKFCYDIGHNNAFDKDFDYIKYYGDKLICLHLHDNMGEKDDHTLNKYGSINWEKFAKKLKEINYNGNLDFEILMHVRKDENFMNVAKTVLKQAKELEKMIKN